MNNVFPKLDKLIDTWCERRCLKPLFYILRDYPVYGEFIAGWGVLLESLLEIQGLFRDELTVQERGLLLELIQEVRGKVNH